MDIGIDIVETKKFKILSKNRGNRFFTNNFSPKELDYCFSYKDPATHLAANFAAKEAVFKSLGRNDIILSSIEIRRNENGKPYVFINGKRHKSVSISLSHTGGIAVAVAIKK
jgi:phosphopantetheine--protein transferase-like protein